MPKFPTTHLYGGAERPSSQHQLSEYAIPTAVIAMVAVLRLAQADFSFDFGAVACFGMAAALFYLGKQ